MAAKLANEVALSLAGLGNSVGRIGSGGKPSKRKNKPRLLRYASHPSRFSATGDGACAPSISPSPPTN